MIPKEALDGIQAEQHRNENEYAESHGPQIVESKKYTPPIVRFGYPIEDADISSAFGARTDADPPNHKGLDFATVDSAESILSSEGGTIETIEVTDSGSSKLTIAHPNGYKTVYMHMDDYSVEVGDTVVKGQKIGSVGDIGSAGATHLHYEIRDESGNQVDPYPLIGQRPGSIGLQDCVEEKNGTLANILED